MLRWPVAISTLSTPVPTEDEKGKSPLRFWLLSVLGVSSCASTEQARRITASNGRTLPFMKADMAGLLFRLAVWILELRVRDSDVHLHGAEADITHLLTVDVVFNVKWHEHGSHGSIVAVVRCPHRVVLVRLRIEHKGFRLVNDERLGVQQDIRFRPQG